MVWKSGIRLSAPQRRELKEFSGKAKDAREYRAALGILLRGEGMSAADIGERLGVKKRRVFEWTRRYRKRGVSGLAMGKPTGRPADRGKAVAKRLPTLLRKDPQAFGYLKGRWVVRDIAKQMGAEGIPLSYQSVHRVLQDLGFRQKRPTLRAPGSLRKDYRRRAEIRRYQKAAAMLLKKG